MLAFTHMGTIQAPIAELIGLSHQDMMKRDIDNGAAFQFVRTFAQDGSYRSVEAPIPPHVLPKDASFIEEPPSAPPP